jgi:hypothetical protein
MSKATRSRSRWREGLTLALVWTTVLWPVPSLAASAPGSGERAPAFDRPLDEAEMAGVVGGWGGAPIQLGETQTGVSGSAGEVDAYLLTVPAKGPNPSVAATIEVSDATGSGSYTVKLARLVNGQIEVFYQEGPASTVVIDESDLPLGLPDGQDVQIQVWEAGGPVPRNFHVAVSPRYTWPPEANLQFANGAPSGAAPSFTMVNGKVLTLALQVDDPNGLGDSELGETDLFLRDNGMAGTNVVRVLGPDRTVLKAETQASGDVSLDNSTFPDLHFDVPGEYLLVLSNTSDPNGGSAVTFVGPYPGQDDTDVCEAVTAPAFGTPILISRSLAPEADRDCFEFSSAAAFSELGLAFDETAQLRGSGANELIVYQEDESNLGQFIERGRKTGSADIFKTIPVQANSSSAPLRYRVVVNTLKDAVIDYELALSLEGPCIGDPSNCTLIPGTAVAVDLSLLNPFVLPIRYNPNHDPLPAPAAATFELDKTSSATFQLTIRGTVGGVPNTPLCQFADNADFFLENCDLTTDDGLAEAVISRLSGGGNTAIVRMGPELITAPRSPITLGAGVGDELTNIGEEDVYTFSLASPTRLGIGFDDQGIGSSSKNIVRVWPAADLEDVLRGMPAGAPVLEWVGTADGGIPAPGPEAPAVPPGDYVLLVDNDGLGTGPYEVCVGPDAGDLEEGVPVPPFGDLSGAATVVYPGQLSCGDTDYVQFAPTASQNLKIVATEDVSGIAGDLDLAVQVLGAGGSWISTGFHKHGSRTVTMRDVPVVGGETYRLVIDNTTVGNTTYTVTISDDD